MRGIIENFQKRLDEMREDSRIFARGARCLEQIRWSFGRKSEGAGEKPGKFDFDGVHELFDRAEAEENYMQAIETAGDGSASSGIKQELALASNQSDVLSGMERDFLMRHRGRIRKLAHEATAKRHGGSTKGVVQSAVMMYLESQLQRVTGNNGNGANAGDGSGGE